MEPFRLDHTPILDIALSVARDFLELIHNHPQPAGRLP
jgi:hypothetical protein